MAWGALAAAAASIASQAASQGASGGISSAFNKRARKQAYKLWKKQTLKGPTLKVKGLKDAGLNPMLALGAGSSGIGGNVPLMMQQIQQETKPDLKGGKEVSMLKKQLEALDSQIRVNDAGSALGVERANGQILTNKQLQLQTQAMERLYENPHTAEALEAANRGGSGMGWKSLGEGLLKDVYEAFTNDK